MIKLTGAQEAALLNEVHYHKPGLSNGQAKRIIDSVEYALIEYRGKFRSQSADQIKRFESAKADIDRAISKTLIDEQWQSADDDLLPFADSKAVLEWLKSEPIAVAAVMSRQKSPIVSGLWKARLAVIDTIEHIEMTNKALWYKDWGTGEPDIRSTNWINESPDNAQLVLDLARTWTRYVDPNFSIGSNGSSSNYTRFIRCALDAIGIEKVVTEAAIRSFSRGKIEPLYLRKAERK